MLVRERRPYARVLLRRGCYGVDADIGRPARCRMRPLPRARPVRHTTCGGGGGGLQLGTSKKATEREPLFAAGLRALAAALPCDEPAITLDWSRPPPGAVTCRSTEQAVQLLSANGEDKLPRPSTRSSRLGLSFAAALTR